MWEIRLSGPTEKPIPSAGAWKKWLDVVEFGHSQIEVYLNFLQSLIKKK